MAESAQLDGLIREDSWLRADTTTRGHEVEGAYLQQT